jgi:uncharacterized protein YggE
MIDAGIKAGMNRIDNITFDLDPDEKQKYQDELVVKALQNAEEKGARTVEALKMKIIGVKSLNI